MLPDGVMADHCVLEHRMFTVLGASLFRRAETDGAPAVIVMLGEREAALPLRSLQDEFDIDDDSADGQMLALIAGALDFVVVPADRRSAARRGAERQRELGTGPGPYAACQRQAAAAARRHGLNSGQHRPTPSWIPRHLAQLDDNPAVRQQVQEAFDACRRGAWRARQGVGCPAGGESCRRSWPSSRRCATVCCAGCRSMALKIERLARGKRQTACRSRH